MQRASAEEQRKARAEGAAAAAVVDTAEAQPLVAARPRTLPSLRNKPKVCVRMRAVCDFPTISPVQSPDAKAQYKVPQQGSTPSGTAPSSAAPSKTASATTAHGLHGDSGGRLPAAVADGAGVSSARPQSADASAKVRSRGSSRPSSGRKSGGGGSRVRVRSRDRNRPQSAQRAAAPQQQPSFDEFVELDDSEASDGEEFEMQLALESEAEDASMAVTDEGAIRCFEAWKLLPIPCKPLLPFAFKAGSRAIGSEVVSRKGVKPPVSWQLPFANYT